MTDKLAKIDTLITPAVGSILTFKGCSWSDGWEFDAPVIIYSPVQRYDISGSIGLSAVEGLVDDICIDLCVDGSVPVHFSDDVLKEFKWRGWSVNGFSKRKSAKHAIVTVKFELDKDGLMTFLTEDVREVK